jgi:hypothetical protein
MFIPPARFAAPVVLPNSIAGELAAAGAAPINAQSCIVNPKDQSDVWFPPTLQTTPYDPVINIHLRIVLLTVTPVANEPCIPLDPERLDPINAQFSTTQLLELFRFNITDEPSKYR